MTNSLDAIDHVALSVSNIEEAAAWYQQHFCCRVVYQDETWAMLQFANTRLALVLPDRHPPHLGFYKAKAKDFGLLKPHRDGTASVYVTDPAGNSVEILATESAPAE